MHTIDLTADNLLAALLSLSENGYVAILDSCGVGHLGSHLLIAGIDPTETIEISDDDHRRVLAELDTRSTNNFASIFTLSYDFGEKLNGIRHSGNFATAEPDACIASFDCLIVHDYDTGNTYLAGNEEKFPAITEKLCVSAANLEPQTSSLGFEISTSRTEVFSNFTKTEYLVAIEEIKERIRCGDTYQTNLTQQFTATLGTGLTPQMIFARLRRQHPAQFAAYIVRRDSTAISASPERFFRIHSVGREGISRRITTSPIKGTRRRGKTRHEDEQLRADLLASSKDRAENTMIVDLLRNDLGRVCQYGTVQVENLCDLEEHPTLFHLVSTISGILRSGMTFSDILTALFPCGSITGAPKISTMRIIDTMETVDRGLSMGAIGYRIPEERFGLAGTTDLSVAIRTMVIRDDVATFNVGGGIVIDSDAEKEYDESLLKAQALLTAIEANFIAEGNMK